MTTDELREAIARTIAANLGEQDYGEFILPDDLKLSYLDQGEVDFGLVADAVLALIEPMMSENERLSKAVCSGVLGDLLAPDENDALVAFVKELRSGALSPKGNTNDRHSQDRD